MSERPTLWDASDYYLIEELSRSAIRFDHGKLYTPEERESALIQASLRKILEKLQSIEKHIASEVKP